MTQLLWKSSKQLGIGVAKNDNGKYVVVCNYNPQGNVYGQFRENLPTITKSDIEAAKLASAEQEKKFDRKISIFKE